MHAIQMDCVARYYRWHTDFLIVYEVCVAMAQHLSTLSSCGLILCPLLPAAVSFLLLSQAEQIKCAGQPSEPMYAAELMLSFSSLAPNTTVSFRSSCFHGQRIGGP